MELDDQRLAGIVDARFDADLDAVVELCRRPREERAVHGFVAAHFFRSDVDALQVGAGAGFGAQVEVGMADLGGDGLRRLGGRKAYAGREGPGGGGKREGRREDAGHD